MSARYIKSTMPNGVRRRSDEPLSQQHQYLRSLDAFAGLCGEQIEESLGRAMGCDRMKGEISRTAHGWTVIVSNLGHVGPSVGRMYQFSSLADMKKEMGAEVPSSH